MTPGHVPPGRVYFVLLHETSTTKFPPPFRHILSSYHHAIISCVPRRTSRVFHAGHLVCSKQDISCVASRTSLVFHARHIMCSTQDMSCAPRTTSRVFQAGHLLCSRQDISCVPTRTCPVLHARKNVSAPNILIIPLKIRHFSSSIF